MSSWFTVSFTYYYPQNLTGESSVPVELDNYTLSDECRKKDLFVNFYFTSRWKKKSTLGQAFLKEKSWKLCRQITSSQTSFQSIRNSTNQETRKDFVLKRVKVKRTTPGWKHQQKRMLSYLSHIHQGTLVLHQLPLVHLDSPQASREETKVSYVNSVVKLLIIQCS